MNTTLQSAKEELLSISTCKDCKTPNNEIKVPFIDLDFELQKFILQEGLQYLAVQCPGCGKTGLHLYT